MSSFFFIDFKLSFLYYNFNQKNKTYNRSYFIIKIYRPQLRLPSNANILFHTLYNHFHLVHLAL